MRQVKAAGTVALVTKVCVYQRGGYGRGKLFGCVRARAHTHTHTNTPGGITRLVKALEFHAEHPGVQDAASWALMVIAWSHQDLKRQVCGCQ